MALHEVSIREIVKDIGEIFGIPLGELRGKGKDYGVTEGGRLFSLVGRKYGHKERETAGFLRKGKIFGTKRKG